MGLQDTVLWRVPSGLPMKRAAFLALALCGCPGWVKAVRSTATAVADICDAVAGGPGLFHVPPPADCKEKGPATLR